MILLPTKASPITRRRNSHDLVKGTVKITDIVKPAEGGDLSYFCVRSDQQLTAFYNAQAVQILKGGVSGTVFEAVAKVAFAKPCPF